MKRFSNLILCNEFGQSLARLQARGQIFREKIARDTTFKVLETPLLLLRVRPSADQSSKSAFGKSALAKTFSNVLSFVVDMTGAHQSSKKQKYFRARFGTCNEQNAFC